MRAFGVGLLFTNDGKYAEHAANLLKTWFLNAQTKMNPNLNFGQGIPGINTGRGIGIIETRGLTEAIDAAILLRGSKSWSEDDHNAFKKWFSEYLTWLTDSPLGNDEAKAHNNHGTHYDAQVICFALFTGQNDLAKKQFEVTKGRIASQFLPDGSQPHELERTTSWNYTNMNLHGFFDLARLGEHFGIDLWHYQTADKKSIRQCLEWLVPFLKNEKKWTHQQIKKREFEVTVSMLKTAAVIYKNADYETLAKQIDPKVYAEPSFQLFY
ncbi:MAG: alginate lyase family protein [Saprospiraceae bacterium]|nr:alginate lyase family protein [Saprospiraceae bacterium]